MWMVQSVGAMVFWHLMRKHPWFINERNLYIKLMAQATLLAMAFRGIILSRWATAEEAAAFLVVELIVLLLAITFCLVRRFRASALQVALSVGAFIGWQAYIKVPEVRKFETLEGVALSATTINPNTSKPYRKREIAKWHTATVRALQPELQLREGERFKILLKIYSLPSRFPWRLETFRLEDFAIEGPPEALRYPPLVAPIVLE